MRHTDKNSFFIGNLSGLNRRQTLPGALGIVSHFSAATLINQAISEYHSDLARSVSVGERAQSVRDKAALERASRDILGLPLGKGAYHIGRYYEALSLNRQGPWAFPEANEILIEVADHGPLLFRAKARVALATNLLIAGDRMSALELYAEAASIGGSCGQGGLHPIFLAAYQRGHIKCDDGDYRGALADIEELGPLARQIGRELPAVLHFYLNSLADRRISVGRIEEASRLSDVLLNSPFREAYPEFGRTSQAMALALKKPSRLFILIGEPFTGPENKCPDADATIPADDIEPVDDPSSSLNGVAAEHSDRIDRAATITDLAGLEHTPPRPPKVNEPSIAQEPVRAALFIIRSRIRRALRLLIVFPRAKSFISVPAENAPAEIGKLTPAPFEQFRWSYIRWHRAYPRGGLQSLPVPSR